MSEEIMVAEVETAISDIHIEETDEVLINTIDLNTFEGRKLSYNTMNNADPLNGHEGEEFAVSNIIMAKSVLVDKETGEVKPVIKTYLVRDDGGAYFSVSEGIKRSAAGILKSFGTPEFWPDGKLHVVCGEVKLQGGRNLKQLKVLD